MASTTIRRIPGPADVSAPASLRPSGANPGRDVEAPFIGGQALARGFDQLSAGLGVAGASITRQENASDFAKADAQWLKGSLDLGTKFQQDGDYQTFDKRITADSASLRDMAAAAIRDPQARQQWLDATELKRITLIQAVNDHGRDLGRSNDRAQMETSIADLADVYADPATPQVTRDAAKRNILAQIEVGKATGLLTPGEAEQLRRAGIDGADENLAINRARVDILVNPDRASTGMGIPMASDGGAGVVSAIEGANGGTMPAMDFSLAKVTADMLGDANFPTDEKLAGAYLSDPDKAAEYANAAAAMLNDRYAGDLTAVVVAMDPAGGTTLADQWVKSGHDEGVLPADVRKRYRQAMVGYQAAVSGERLPISAGPNVDLENTDPAVLDRFETLQSQFGEIIPLVSAARSAEHNKAVGGASKSQHLGGRALDLDVSGLSEERRIQLIGLASAMGFTGIGVYKNSIHLDTGDLRAWGPDYHLRSVPAWAKDAIDAHVSGTVSEPPLLYTKVDPRYAAIPFDKRLQLATEARRAAKESNVGLQASIDTIVENAPAAIANTGTYDAAPMPSPADFVKAYGAADGIQRFKSFKSSTETAKMIFGMSTASNDTILAQVAAATPRSTGNDASLESKRFDQLSAAAEQTLKARAADPAGYTMGAFPKIADAFQAAQKDPSLMGAALTAMQAGQAELGLDEMQLLPKAYATQAATSFNDTSKPANERVGAVASLVLSTNDEKQQLAIYKQLVASGVPEYTQGAVAAMVRGDVGAAQNLMRAVMIDPAKLAGDLPGDITGPQISGAIQDRIMAEGEIGDVIYGVSSGSIDNFQRVLADTTLIERDVRLHLIDGSAGGDLNKAVDLTIKDMYGDVQIVRGEGVKIALPAGVDPEPLKRGFVGLQPQVADALRRDMADGMVQILGDQVDIRSSGMSDVVSMGIDNAVGIVLREGYFINAGQDQFQFFNPYTGTVIGKPDGEPLLFSKSDVTAAGANVGATPTYGWEMFR
jgi:hypothetical protein